MKQWLNIDKPYDQINHGHGHCFHDIPSLMEILFLGFKMEYNQKRVSF